MQGVQQARMVGVFAQRMPQQGDDPVQHSRGDVAVAPDGIQDLIPGEDAAGLGGQQGEYGECLGLQRLLFARAP